MSTNSSSKYEKSLEVQLIRAARTLLGWNQEELAAAADVSISALKNYERGVTQMMPALVALLVRALHDGGVEIELGERPAIRYRVGHAPMITDEKVAERLVNRSSQVDGR